MRGVEAPSSMSAPGRARERGGRGGGGGLLDTGKAGQVWQHTHMRIHCGGGGLEFSDRAPFSSSNSPRNMHMCVCAKMYTCTRPCNYVIVYVMSMHSTIVMGLCVQYQDPCRNRGSQHGTGENTTLHTVPSPAVAPPTHCAR